MKASNKTVFVDMDGIVTDFIGGVFRLHNIPKEKQSEFKGNYDVHSLLGMTINEFWGHLDRDEDFWANLELTEDANKIMLYLEDIIEKKNIYFLSSPAMNPRCHYGKALWIQKNFPEYINRLILTGHKHFLADRDRLLIDDSDKNCDRFKKNHGHAILYPRPWNSRYSFSNKSLELMKKELRRFV